MPLAGGPQRRCPFSRLGGVPERAPQSLVVPTGQSQLHDLEAAVARPGRGAVEAGVQAT